MKTPFFEEHGNKIKFENTSDLIEKLSKINSSAPGRIQGRKSHHREKFCIKFYLLTLSQNNLLRFPMSVTKSESPDFFILSNGETTALEVTEASTEDYQRAMTELEKCPDGTLLESHSIFNHGMDSQKGEYKKALRTPGKKLNGEGWVGDSVEKEWIDIILNAIDKKISDLNKPNFQTASRYELLVYDNSHVAEMVHLKAAIPLLKNAIFEKFGLISKRNFRSISVIHSDELLYDVMNSCTIFLRKHI